MRFLNLNKSYGYVLTTLLCLVFLGAVYFFIYLPKNEKRIEEQRFRTLQNVHVNIHEKIENTLSLIKNILKVYKKDVKDSDYIKRYIEQYPKDKFEISPIYEQHVNKNKVLKDSLLNVPNLLVNDATKKITLQLQRQINNGNDTLIIQCSIAFSFEQIIKNILPDDIFDQYIVFSKNRTVYESFPSGILNPKDDSLFNPKNGINGSYAKDIAVGGMDYKLFLQPITFDNNNRWILGGLLSNSRYQEERSALPAGIVMLLVTLVLVMIVIFPWIKLYQMGSKDRLTLMDAASSIVVSMLLMSLLFFCFFKYNVSIRGNDSPDSKHILAAKISTAFYNETKRMYTALCAYDTFRNNNKKNINVVNLEDSNITFSDPGSYVHSNINLYTKEYLDALEVQFDSLKYKINNKLNNNCKKEFYWLNERGAELYNWTTDSFNAPHGDFKTRDYFNKIKNESSYYLDGDFSKRFYLDQVVSWYTGTFTSVISIPSIGHNTSVAALSFTMRSVDDAVLPTGYTFAIIDNKGKVLYHSVGSRNLKENLKSEFSDSADIVSCINARAEGEFYTRYYSKNYAVSIMPFNNLPYFMVVFSDTSYKDIRDVETYSFTFSMLLLLFLYIVFQLCVTILVSSRHSFFKKQLFDTSWIGPKLSCHKDYILASINNFSVIIILILFFQKKAFLSYLFLVLFAVTFIALFMNILFVKRYWQEGRYNNVKYKKIAVIWLSILLIIINISAFFFLERNNFRGFFLIEASAIALGCINIFCAGFFARKLPENFKKIFTNEKNYIKSFSFMILTGLIITSGIPVAFFYITSYNYEQNLGIRHRQTDYASRLFEKQPAPYNIKIQTIDNYIKADTFYKQLWKSYEDTVLNNPNLLFTTSNNKKTVNKNSKYYDSWKDSSFSIAYYANVLFYKQLYNYESMEQSFNDYDKMGVYYDSSWINTFPSIVDYNTINIKYDTTESYKTRKILGIFHLTIGEKSVKTDKLYIPYATDTSIIYQPLLINTNADSSYVSTYEKLDVVNKYLKLTSFNLNYIVPAIFKSKGAFVYWLLLCVALVVFYYIINNILKKLFCLNLPDLKVWKDLDEKLISNNNLNRLLFVIGLPGAGKKDVILKKIKDKKLKYNGVPLIYDLKDVANNNVFIADLINMPDTGAAIENDVGWKRFCRDAMDKKNHLVIINHFEYNILDEYTNVAKLNFLEQLMLKNTSKIIILSTIHPTSFLDSINDVSIKTNAAIKPSHDLERWNVLLGHYRIVIIPIATIDTELVPAWKQLISKETDSTHFLQDMKQAAFQVIDATLQEENVVSKSDELAYKLQVTAHYFYMYIWQSLTKEEKFLLYDLAEDNLVNSYDDYNLTMLIAKGVIVNTNGSLQLFNKGFRNFILTAIGNTEAMKIKDRIKENGNWSNLKTPLVIVIMAILAFLLISQQEAYSKLLTYVAALTAGVPTILKIFSLFDKNATKSNP